MKAIQARSYHHGNLRDALIIAAAELIEERGSLDFSITDTAKRAGVSNAAPYRHFRDKEDLLDNVRHLAFMGLHEHARRLLDDPRHPKGSAEAIIALGCGYLEYAREKRAFFSLMWEDRGQMATVRDEIESKLSGFNVLLEAVTAFCRRLGHCDPNTHTQPIKIATQLWAMAHGIATLECNHMLDLFDRSASPEQLLRDSSLSLLRGLYSRVDDEVITATLAPQAELPLF